MAHLLFTLALFAFTVVETDSHCVKVINNAANKETNWLIFVSSSRPWPLLFLLR